MSQQSSSRRDLRVAAVSVVVAMLAGLPVAPARAQAAATEKTVTNQDMGPWRIKTDANSAPTGGIEFVDGPDGDRDLPDGLSNLVDGGSLKMRTGSGNDAFTGKHRIVTDKLEGVTLEDLSLAYSTYVHQAPQSDQLAPALRVTVDYVTPAAEDVTTTSVAAEPETGTLIFEPAYSPEDDSGNPWKRWDATEGSMIWWSPTPVPGTDPDPDPGTDPGGQQAPVCTTLTVPDGETFRCEWSEIEDAQGQATVREVAIVVGDETNAGNLSVWNDFVGYVDAVEAGTEGDPTLYDFEPATVDPPLGDPAYAYALGAPAGLGPDGSSDGANHLWRFRLDGPSQTVPEPPKKIQGLEEEEGEEVAGIDFHPESGLLYALTRTPLTEESTAGEPVTALGRIRVIDPQTPQVLPLPAPDSDAAPVAGPDELPAAGFPLTGEASGISFHPSDAPEEPASAESADPAVDWLLSVVTDTAEKITIDPTTGAVVARTTTRYQPEPPETAGVAEGPSLVGLAEHDGGLWAIDSERDQIVDVTDAPFAEHAGGSLRDTDERAALDVAPDGTVYAALTNANSTSTSSLHTVDDDGNSTRVAPSIGGTIPVVDVALPPTGTLRLSDSEYSYDETDSEFETTVTVERVGGSFGELEATLTAQTPDGVVDGGGSCSGDSDFFIGDGLVSFEDGTVGTHDVDITICDDADAVDETFTVELTAPSEDPHVLGDPSEATVTIEDDEPGTIEFAPGTYSIDESDSSGEVEVSITADGGADGVTVNVATVDDTAIAGDDDGDGDYDAVDKSVTFQAGAGEQSKTVSVPINDDEEVEGDQTFDVQAKVNGDVRDTATVTILDDPAGTIAFGSGTYDVAESDSTELTVTRTDGTEGEVVVTLTGRSDDDEATDDASAGEDYEVAQTSVTFDGTDESGNLSNQDETEAATVTAYADGEFEGDEVFAVDLSIDSADGDPGADQPYPDLGDPSTATVTILDHTLGTAIAVTEDEDGDGDNDNDNDLISFQPDDPATVTDTIAVEGLGDGENLVGIDYRAESDDSDEALFGVSRSDEGLLKLYSLDFGGDGALTAHASPVGEVCLPVLGKLLPVEPPEETPGQVADIIENGLCVEVVEILSLAPTVSGTQFGVDVDPAGGGVHVTSEAGEHVVFDTALGLATPNAPLTYEADPPDPPDVPDVPEIDPDNPPSPGELVPDVPSPDVDPSVEADVVSVAHDGAGTLRGLDATRDALVEQAASTTPLGDGRFEEVATLVAPDGSDVNVTDRAGFDVLGDALGFVAFGDGTVHRVDLDAVGDGTVAAAPLGAIGGSATGDATVTPIDLAIRPAAVVDLTSTSGSVQETSDAASFDLLVERTGGEGHEFTVDYAIGTEGDSATCGEDYVVGTAGDCSAATGSLHFASGEASKPIDVDVLDDHAWEGDETLTVTLSDPTSGAVLGDADATLTILEDGVGTIGFATDDSGSPDVSADEDAGSATLDLTREDGMEGEVVVRVTSAPGDDRPATPGEDGAGDYDTVDTTVTFPAGEKDATRSVEVLVHDDDLLEGPEKVELTVEIVTEESPEPAEPGDDNEATLTIEDVEPGVVYGITEPDDNAEQQLVKVGQPGQPGTATEVGTLALSDGNPIDDEIVALDFNRNDDTLYALARDGGTGQLYKIGLDAVATPVGEAFSDPPLDGSFFGADFDPTTGELRVVSDAAQNLVLTLGTDDGGDSVTVSEPSRLEFSDDGGDAPVVTALANASSDDGISSLFGIHVQQDDARGDSLVRHVDPEGKTGCRCELEVVGTLDGDDVSASELAGFDTDGRGTAVAAFEANSTNLYTLDLTDGSADEVGEVDVNASLVGVSFALVGTLSLAGAPDAAVAESDGAVGGVEFDVERTGGTLEQVSADVAVQGDVEGLQVDPATVTFLEGDEAAKTVTVTWDDDALHEDDVEVMLRLTDPQGGVAIGDPGEVTFTVGDDDDPPQVSVGDVEVDEGDSGTTEAVVPVRLHDAAGDPLASGKPVTVTAATAEAMATSGDDYESTTTSITIEPGDKAGEITVPIVGDAVDEADETFEVSLDSIEGATPADTSAEVTIADDDPAPVLRVADAGTVDEGDSGTTPAVFEVRLSGVTERTVTVRAGTAPTGALEAVDYDAVRATLTFAPGETTRAVHVPVRGDTADEPDETFELRLSAPANATIGQGAGVATIRDDDVPPEPEVKEVVVEPAPPRGNVTPSGDGYWIPSPVGTVEAFGDAAPVPGISGLLGVAFNPEREIVDVASDQTGEGVWLLERSGGVHALGSAHYHGSIPERRAQGFPIGTADAASIAATPGGDGYAILDEDGGIHTFGDARFHGSIPQRRAEGLPIGVTETVDIAMSPTGDGYVVLEDNGGVHTFGDARYHGSIPALRLAGVPVGDAELVSIALAPGGDGYWILDEHGGVHTFGDARYHGSIPALQAAGQNIGIAGGDRIEATASGEGYWIFDRAGGVFTFGDAPFRGSVPGRAAG